MDLQQLALVLAALGTVITATAHLVRAIHRDADADP
jgi:hypothetical protein